MDNPDPTLRFDRSRFEDLELQSLIAEQNSLKEQLRSYDELLSSARVEVTTDEVEAHRALEETIAQASAELDRRLQALAAAASAGQPIPFERIRGLGDLWMIARAPELRQAVFAASAEAPGRRAPEVEAERGRVLRELAEHEAEITLRLAENQLSDIGGTVDGALRDELVRAVFRRYFSTDAEIVTAAPDEESA
jgi:hypothetical protein